MVEQDLSRRPGQPGFLVQPVEHGGGLVDVSFGMDHDLVDEFSGQRDGSRRDFSGIDEPGGLDDDLSGGLPPGGESLVEDAHGDLFVFERKVAGAVDGGASDDGHVDGHRPEHELWAVAVLDALDERVGGGAIELSSGAGIGVGGVHVGVEAGLGEEGLTGGAGSAPESQGAEREAVGRDAVGQDQLAQAGMQRVPAADHSCEQAVVGERLDSGQAGWEDIEPAQIAGMALGEEARLDRVEDRDRQHVADRAGDPPD